MNLSLSFRRLRAPLLVAAAAALSACDGGGGGTGAQTAASVEVTGPATSLEAGATLQLSATVRDAGGKTIQRPVTWSSSNGSVASVSASGAVQGLRAGAATITATADGKVGTFDVGVTPAAVASITISPDPVSVYANEEVFVTATLKSASGAVIGDRFPLWSTGNTGVAQVNGTGKVTGLAEGSTTLTASAEGKSATVQVSVLPARMNLSIAGLYVTQSVQRPDGSVPLVAGRDGLLRVFGRATQANAAAPSVRVRLFQNGAQVDEIVLPAPRTGVVTSVDEGSLTTSWNVRLPGSRIQPGLSVLAEINPDGAAQEDDATDNRFPVSGQPLALNVREVPPFRVRFIPVHQTNGGRTGDVTTANVDGYLDVLKRVYPLAEIQATVRAPYTSNGAEVTGSNGEAWQALLPEIDAVRVAEGATDQYYYGVVSSTGGGTAGLGYIGRPTAIGYDGQIRDKVYAHESGHNFARYHADCGGPKNPDAAYPYPGAVIGVHGYDIFANAPKSPGQHDLMSYCYEWISDYTYNAVLNWLTANPAAAGGTAAGAAEQPALLVWGRMSDGRVTLEPAFRVTTRPALPARSGPYTLEGVDAEGRAVFSLRFAPTPVADVAGEEAHFAFAVPLSPQQMEQVASIRLVGNGRRAELRSPAAARAPLPAGRALAQARRAGGRVGLRWDAARHPVVMVRDARTGQVLSFARGGEASLAAPGRELELVFSDGVRSRTERVTPGS